MAITTLARAKALLNITVPTYDIWINALISQVEQDYVSIRNCPFDVGTKINIATTGPLAADEEITVEIGNWSVVGGTAQGREYDVILRNGDTANVIARRIANQIIPSDYYKVEPATINASSSSADVLFIERFEDWMEDVSVLDISIDTSTSISTTISKMETFYPDGAEFTAAKMIQFHLNTAKAQGIESESLGDYSVKFSGPSALSQDYPKPIVGGIKRFVKTF